MNLVCIFKDQTIILQVNKKFSILPVKLLNNTYDLKFLYLRNDSFDWIISIKDG